MKAVLSYSGGLDTSVCIKLLQEKYGYDVITVTVDVGLSKKELTAAADKAEKLGAKHYKIDAKKEFVEDYIFRSIKANGCYEGYPLSTALARPLIAKKIVEVGRKEDAEVLAHGATGKGNDQFRFESVFRIEAPDMKIVAPIREGNMTRNESLSYAKKHGIPIGEEKRFSIDENLWGRSVEGGLLEDPGTIAPEEVFEWTKITNKEAEIIDLEFNKGVPVSLSEKKMNGVDLIETLNRIGGSHGVGRIDIIEDRILGLKARETYETPAAVIILNAHQDLESLVLTREEIKFKRYIDLKWGELVYRGLWNEPLRSALDAFIETTQVRVLGSVKMELREGGCSVVARSSKYSLYSQEAVSFDDSEIDQRGVEGILKYHSLQSGLSKKKRKNS